MTRGAARLILTGESGCGKTATCLAVVERLRTRGWTTAGVVSPGVWVEGEKVGIDALDLSSGEVRRLAERAGGAREMAGPSTAGWQFDSHTLAWCNARLAEATETDLLVADELGPLELERGEGLMQALRTVDEGQFRMGLIVVRPRLVPLAQQRWPGASRMLLKGLQDLPDRVDEILSLSVSLETAAQSGG